MTMKISSHIYIFIIDFFLDIQIRLDMSHTSNTSETNCHRIKVISLGSMKSGKTCIIKRFCECRFVSKYIPTIGIDFGVKPVQIKQSKNRYRCNSTQTSNDHTIHAKINFFDLSGDTQFFEVRKEFYQDTCGAFLVYDVTNKKSFLEIPKWMNEMKTYGKEDVPIVLCANKIDQVRKVSEKEGLQLASEYGLLYYETSCKTGANIDDMFEFLFKVILENINDSNS